MQNKLLIYLLAVSLLSFPVFGVFAQSGAPVTVTGTVKSEKGEPLAGASVVEQGTQNGTVTGTDGKFRLTTRNANATFEVRLLGFAALAVPLNGRTTVEVALTEEAAQIEDLVVIGYGSARRSDLTGSIASVRADELNKVKTGSFLDALQGKVAGVMVTSSSGAPGAGVDISIRGANSINAGTQPLYVIDGVIMDINPGEVASASYGDNVSHNPLAGINSNDIESIDILKDASATAIYGARGANGVVIVTTRSGKEGVSAVTFESYVGVSNVLRTLDVLDGYEYVQYGFEVRPTLYGRDTDGDGVRDSPIDVTGMPMHNWQKEIYRTALTHSYDLGLDAGSNRTKLSASIGYLDQQGLVRNNDMKNYSGRIRVNHNANKFITLGSGINGSYQVKRGVTSTGGPSQSFGLLQAMSLFRPIVIPGSESYNPGDDYNAGMTNPMGFVTDAVKEITILRVIADAFAVVRFTKDLNLRSSINVALTNSTDKGWYPNTTAWGFITNGRVLDNTVATNSWATTHTLNYNHTFNTKHVVGAMAGFECSDYIAKSTALEVQGFPVQIGDMSEKIALGELLPRPPSNGKSEISRMSMFGRFNYSYDNRYLFTATLRRDGSSVFGVDNKWALFPSAALAWRVSQEEFFKSVKAVSDLKLRLSYGASGNDRIPPYTAQATTSAAPYGNVLGAYDIGLASAGQPYPKLRWESTDQVNAGIDLGVIQNRITLTCDAYYKETRDMLLFNPTSGQTGTFQRWENTGSVSNKGLEIGLQTVNIKKKDFSWNTSVNFNMNRNKVLSLGGVDFISVTGQATFILNVGRVVVGHPIGTGWGYIFDGIYQKSDFNPDGSLKTSGFNPDGSIREGVTSIAGRSVYPGDMKFKDIGGSGNTIDAANDMTIISHSAPKHFGGINNNFQYRDFDFSFFFQWSYGNEILNVLRYQLEGRNPNQNLLRSYYYNRWTDTHPSNSYPSLNDPGRAETSTYYVEDASYLRLKNVVLGYNLPLKYAARIGLKSLRLYTSVDNLITFTNYKGNDPEIAYNNPLIMGLDNGTYPRARTFIFGVNLKF